MLPHRAPASAIESSRREDRRMTEKFVHAHAEKRREARGLFFARDGVELVGDVEIEERSEARVPVDQSESDVARQKIAQSLLARNECVELRPCTRARESNRSPGPRNATRPSRSRSSTAPLITMNRLSGAVAGDDRFPGSNRRCRANRGRCRSRRRSTGRTARCVDRNFAPRSPPFSPANCLCPASALQVEQRSCPRPSPRWKTAIEPAKAGRSIGEAERGGRP